jgi:drug/metabolite transporter (DMT)-like permease
MRKELDSFAVALMVLLCICWGSQQVIMKATAAEMEPLFQVAIRSALAAVVVLALLLTQGEAPRWNDRTLFPGIMAGLLFCGEFSGVSLGLNYTSASHMSVFLYTSPVFAAIGLHCLIPEERLIPRQWAGIALAFAGIVVIFLNRGATGGGNTMLGDTCGILAGLSWALTTLVIRRTALAEAAPAKTLFYQLAVTGLALLAVCAFSPAIRSFPRSSWGWASLAYQTLVICFASFFAWFWLLRKYLATRLSVFSFLTPLFGVFFGVALLHEPLERSFLVGAAMIFVGIAGVTKKRV